MLNIQGRTSLVAVSVLVVMALGLSCGGDSSTGPTRPGPAARLAFSVQPATVVAGTAFSPALMVTVQDAQGITVTSATPIITVALTGGTGTTSAVLSGALTQTASGGIATFSGLSIDKVGASYTLTATASGLNGAISGSFDVTFGSAAKLVISSQPADVAAGASIAPAIQVTVQDALGNTVTNSTAMVTVAITSGSGTTGAALGGTLSVGAASGVATFTNLTVDKTGTGYSLTATAASLTSATSQTFAVAPGAASKLSFSVPPSAVSSGTAINPAVRVVVQDALGNTVTGAAMSITMALTTGTGTAGAVLGGTRTTTSLSGVATFGDLTVDKAGTGYTLTATAASIAAATSGSFAVTPGAAAKLAFASQPSNTVAGSVISPALRVTIQDAQANDVPSATNSVNLTITGGTGTSGANLQGTLTKAAVGGVATFSDLNLHKAGTGYTLTASAIGLVSATSSSFNVTAGAPVNLVLIAPSLVADTVGAAIQPSFRVIDIDSNGVSGEMVAFSVDTGGGSVARSSSVSGTGGIATPENWTLGSHSGRNVLSASLPSLTPTPRSSLAVNGLPVFRQLPVSGLRPGADFNAIAYNRKRGRLVYAGWNGIWELDPVAATWTRLDSLHNNSGARVAILESRQQIVMVTDNGQGQGSAFVYDYATRIHSRTTLGDVPSARQHHAMVYDSVNDRVLLFGGVIVNGDPNPVAELYSWNGVRWTRLPDPPIGPRAGHRMVLDPRTGNIWIHGGTDLGFPWAGILGRSVSSTWVLSPSGDWRHVADNLCCAAGALGWDEGRGVLVQAGGLTFPTSVVGPSVANRETWELLDGTWIRSTAPTPNLDPVFRTFVYSSVLGKLMYNGCGSSCSVTELWTYGDP